MNLKASADLRTLLGTLRLQLAYVQTQSDIMAATDYDIFDTAKEDIKDTNATNSIGSISSVNNADKAAPAPAATMATVDTIGYLQSSCQTQGKMIQVPRPPPTPARSSRGTTSARKRTRKVTSVTGLSSYKIRIIAPRTPRSGFWATSRGAGK